MLKNIYIVGIINQIAKIAVGPCLLISIPHYLSIESQGYWYFFLGAVGFFMLAELGVLTICGSFSAHESNKLKSIISKENSNPEHLKNASIILDFSLRWIKSKGSAYIITASLFGGCLLTARSVDEHWLTPWIIITVSAYINLRNTTLLAFMEGIGLIAKSQSTKCAGTIVYLITTLALLISGLGINSLALGYLAGSITTSLIIKKQFGEIILKLKSIEIKNKEKYSLSQLGEMTKRSAICSIGGCLSFQSISIMAFLFYDQATAGRIGLTLGLFSVIYALSLTFLNITLPKIGSLFSEGKISEARKLSITATAASLSTYILLSTALLAVLGYSKLPYIHLLASRLEEKQIIYIAAACWIPQLIINGIAGYVRSQRKEPFASASLFSGIYVAFFSAFIAANFDERYFLIGLFSSYAFTLPWFVINLIKEEKNQLKTADYKNIHTS